MWVASWNAKGYTTLYTNKNTTGYCIGTSSSPTTYNADMSSTTEIGNRDTLYYPVKASADVETGALVANYSNGFLYWLASPSCYSTSNLVCVGQTGNISGNMNANDCAVSSVRPVVRLKSEVLASKDSNGIWQLSM
jgi:hypothetical protein